MKTANWKSNVYRTESDKQMSRDRNILTVICIAVATVFLLIGLFIGLDAGRREKCGECMKPHLNIYQKIRL